MKWRSRHIEDALTVSVCARARVEQEKGRLNPGDKSFSGFSRQQSVNLRQSVSLSSLAVQLSSMMMVGRCPAARVGREQCTYTKARDHGPVVVIF